MKVIRTGATGLVGHQLLEQCISSSEITHIYALSQKQLPNQVCTSAKVTTILHDDFTSYPAALLDQISDAEACLWAIGGLVQKSPSVEACKLANITSTLAAATAFADHVAPNSKQDQKFRFAPTGQRLLNADLPFGANVGAHRRLALPPPPPGRD